MNTLDCVEHIYVSPAYGRRYESLEDAIKDWESGKDFLIKFLRPTVQTGRYINISDVEKYSPHACVYLLSRGKAQRIHRANSTKSQEA